MQFQQVIQNLSEARVFHRKALPIAPPQLGSPIRFPYGAFRFKTQLPKGTIYLIAASPDVKNWTIVAKGISDAEPIEYVDSEAYKFSSRFYRVIAGNVPSRNVLGYVSFTVPPGFSMIANPLDGPSNRVGELFSGWPEGTSLNKFDPRFFKVQENEFKNGRWMNPSEKLLPGEGAICFNPTQDYKTHNFLGDVLQGNHSIPIPPGFSIRSSLLPHQGSLDELHFPIADGDVIHLFDRDQQKYVLYPYESGKWSAGVPVVGLAESFWVAKAKPGNWMRNLIIG